MSEFAEICRDLSLEVVSLNPRHGGGGQVGVGGPEVNFPRRDAVGLPWAPPQIKTVVENFPHNNRTEGDGD